MTEWVLLAVSVLLVLACAGFVAAEFSFLTVDRSAVAESAACGDRRAGGVQAALRMLSTQLSGVQVGITLTNLMIGFLAEPSLAAILRGPLAAMGVSAGLVDDVAIVCGILMATAVTMVFGELVPKNLAIARPLGTARFVERYARGFTFLARPAVLVLNGSANAVVRRLGVEPQEELRSGRTSEELVALIRRSAQEGTLDRDTAALMEGSVSFRYRTAADVMTPRVVMRSLVADAPLSELVELAGSTGHSRFPIVAGRADDEEDRDAGEADEVLGAVHVKHVTLVPAAERRTVRVSAVMIPVAAVPTTMRLETLLDQLREGGFQMAVVVDEYGGTAGVVTLEDVVEELVGEIADEHDRVHAPIRQRSDGSWSASGRLRPDEVQAHTGIALPTHEDYDTLAGLVLQRHGHIPEVGTAVTVSLDSRAGAGDDTHVVPEARLTVERMDGIRIDRIRLELLDDPS